MENLEIVIYKDFSLTPGPRYSWEGDYCAVDFREKILYPKLLEAISAKVKLYVNLDGTAGYGTSFLEEAFGGLIREQHLKNDDINKTLVIISEEEPFWIERIKSYINEAKSK